MRSFLSFILIAFFAQAAHSADSDRSRDIDQRIGLALWKPASLQLMTKTACLAMAGLHAEDQRTRARLQVIEFQSVLEGLIRGDAGMGLMAKYDADEIARLEELEELAAIFTPSVLQIAHRDKHSVIVQSIFDRVDWTTMRAQQYADWVMTAYVADMIGPDALEALRDASHLRLLSQRALKEGCFAAYNIGGAAMDAKLARTLAEVERLFEALELGLPGPMTASFQTARTHWAQIEGNLRDLKVNGVTDISALERLLADNEALLPAFEAMIAGYLRPA